jgi:heme-degrading monooxygenase HmoA
MQGYVSVWEFEVPEDRVAAFREAYGPTGSWAQLFSDASGYLRTELYRDLARPDRFMTVDHWESEDAWLAFLADHTVAYDALDNRYAGMAVKETPVGAFVVLADENDH